MHQTVKPLIEVRNITKEFPGVKALNGVSFDIRPGEVHALVGENGAGKSTIIKILMGVYTKTSGEIYLNGEKIVEVKIYMEESRAKVTVFNTGSPIPEEDLNHIWDKFYKVDKAHTREYGGNGIGLSIVKAIMESFHQEYGVKNYENGVEFWFTLDRK